MNNLETQVTFTTVGI